MISEPNIPSASHEAEPRAGLATVPLWLIILFALLFYFGMLYADRYGGGISPVVYEPYHGLDELRALEPKPVGGVDLARGRRVYESTCGQCHQASGLGSPGMFPPLARSEWVNEPDPSRLIRIALNGVQGPITVNGQEWNVIMQVNAKQLNLSDEDLAAVLSYIRQAWGNKAPPVTPEEVKQVREATVDKVPQWTVPELMGISVKK